MPEHQQMDQDPDQEQGPGRRGSGRAVAQLPEQSTEMVMVETAEIPTAVVRFTDWAMDRMKEAFDTTFGQLPEALAAQGLDVAGPAFALHHRRPEDTADFEVGLPLSAPLETALQTPGGLRIEPSRLPAGRVAAVSAIGGYDRLSQTWSALLEAIAETGARPALPFWEVYVTEPSPCADPATLRTDLFTLLS